jgi:hypothetical protein
MHIKLKYKVGKTTGTDSVKVLNVTKVVRHTKTLWFFELFQPFLALHWLREFHVI